jgi:imidazoleglycerol-phosphate dehydratase
MAQLFTLHERSDTRVKLQKSMQEVDIVMEVSAEHDAALVPDTGIGFLDHLVASLSWGLCMSIGCTATVGRWRSTHTIAEDTGQTLGAALKYLYYRKMVAEGINAFGSAEACLDESLVRAMVSIEGRRNAFVTVADACPGGRNELVEDLKSADCVAFIEGFAQGLPATVRVDLLAGADPHHVWESAFTALGEALRIAYVTNPFRIAKNNPYYADEGVADASLA